MGQGIRLLVDQGFMTQSPHLLNQSIGLFMVLVVGLAIGTFARFYLVSWIGERVVADIRRQVFNHLVDTPSLDVPKVSLNTAGLTPIAAPATTTWLARPRDRV